MSDASYEVIVVGARCAGAPTAMLLARAGHRVLLVDRDVFPSDTVSTQLIHPPGVAALDRWGLLDRVVDSGCPPIDSYAFDFGPFAITGRPGDDAHPVSYAPRRTVLDAILVEAAVEAGVDVREGFSVREILRDGERVVGLRGDDGTGGDGVYRADVVVGADGRTSIVAKAVGAEQYNTKPLLAAGYYAYFSGLPTDGVEAYIRPDRFCVAIPTNDDWTIVFTGWPRAEFDANRADLEASAMATVDLAPDFAARVRVARRETRFVGTSVPNFMRKPFGPGWALVGDAGYCKDPITAQGISDAFRDAERCARALHEWLTGVRPFEDAMAEHQAARDAAVGPMYDFTTQQASFDPPPPEVQELLAVVADDPEASRMFVQMNTGVISPAEFFDPANIGRIVERAGVNA